MPKTREDKPLTSSGSLTSSNCRVAWLDWFCAAGPGVSLERPETPKTAWAPRSASQLEADTHYLYSVQLPYLHLQSPDLPGDLAVLATKLYGLQSRIRIISSTVLSFGSQGSPHGSVYLG